MEGQLATIDHPRIAECILEDFRCLYEGSDKDGSSASLLQDTEVLEMLFFCGTKHICTKAG